MENSSEISNANGAKILQQFKEIKFHLNNYIDEVTGTAEDIMLPNDPLNRPMSDYLKSFLVAKIPEYVSIIQNNIELFENHDFAEILLNDVNSLRSTIIYNNSNNLAKVIDSIKSFMYGFENIRLSIIAQQNARNLISELESQVNKAKKNVENLDSAKLALESNETDKVFIELSEKYEDEYELNNKYFTYSLILTVCCTFLSIAYTFNTPIGNINWPAFISVKILIIAVGITLCTLFLKRSAHAKKLYEKAYQTHVEINAYPIFIKSLELVDQQEITKELALRYFGNDIDQTQNDKIGDLMQDQLSAGTELIKASAELVKIKSENGGK